MLFYQDVLLTTLLCAALAVAGLAKWKSKATVAVFVFGMLFGSSSEMIATSFGVWSYAAPSVLNIPWWLFVVWGSAAAFIYQTAIEFERLGLHR